MGRSCCRLHRVNEVPSGRGKTATLSSQSVCKCAHECVCEWGWGDQSDNEPPPALIGIICLPRLKGAHSLARQSVLSHKNTHSPAAEMLT